ncbi:MAG: hypothetical protein GXP62_21275, partial [Oligoflexia bacterium]|nr:hypothetical protein [Oligoflexia bacterium]
PATGPVFSVDLDSMLAEVDPAASPQALDQALAAQGLAPRLRPDRPLATWLPALRRTALDVWEVPLFAVQARFDDGVSARIGPAPRSAAGPDLRLPLLRRATAELVQIPVRRLDPQVPDIVVRPVSKDMDPRDLRPTWRKDDRWGFAASLAPLSMLIQTTPARGKAPRRSPTAARLHDRSDDRSETS